MIRLLTYQSKYRESILDLFQLNVPTYFDPKERADLENYLDTEIEDYFVAVEDEKIIGCGGCNIKDTTGWLAWYIVHPDHHGQGVGRSLVQNSLDLLKNKYGLKNIVVRTSQLTDAFYAKFSFRLISIQKDYWGKGLDLYHMVWP